MLSTFAITHTFCASRRRGLHDTRAPGLTLGFLRRYFGNAEDNADYKMISYFTYESRDTLKSFTLLITVKTTTKLNLAHSGKFDIKKFIILASSRRSLSRDNSEFGDFT